ncbi:hypothetical protein EB796_022552 [Bugula neritina]|uniref:Uncharacterized protein n=1 Tax=Bugula neritina TaxID=10212 RepID=A0A7J7IZB6_BUGNE|nr:hypothetical protein EB796_022552 [Bugula neritina]
MTEVLVGGTEAGNANGPAQSSEFNITASFVQLDSSTLLISDQGNRCIRKFDRFSKQVSEYAGSCDPTQRFYSRASYKPWEAFNSPGRMLLVDNQVVILDRVGSDSLIVSKDLNSGLVNTIWDVGSDATDFVYEPTYKSYIVAERVGVL